MLQPHSEIFSNQSVNLEVLRQRAYNLRWATVPRDVIPLTAADPDFPCAPEITRAISEFSAQRYFSYGPPEGLPAFKMSMATWFNRHRNIPVTPSLVFPVDSAAFGIYITCKAFLSPGDEAIIFDPVDFLFRYSVEAVGAHTVPFAIPAGAEIDFDAFEKCIGKATKMLCLCNPLNPTGKVFTKNELKRFGELAVKYGLIILSDEIWSDIVFSPNVFTSIASLGKEIMSRTVTVTGFSKSYGLAGLRIGAVAAPSEAMYLRLIQASMHHSTIHGTNIVSQVAAVAALDECQPWLGAFVKHLHAMRKITVDELNKIPGFYCVAPQGCYVAFVNITGTGKTSQQVKDILFESAKVAVVPGLKEWFGAGAEGYIRLSFATSEKILTDALSRIHKTIIEL